MKPLRFCSNLFKITSCYVLVVLCKTCCTNWFFIQKKVIYTLLCSAFLGLSFRAPRRASVRFSNGFRFLHEAKTTRSVIQKKHGFFMFTRNAKA